MLPFRTTVMCDSYSSTIEGLAGASRKSATKQQLGVQGETSHKADPNCNQPGSQSDSQRSLRVSLDGSLSQPDANDYHWYEEDDLSETVDSSSCTEQTTLNQSLSLTKETNDPHYVAIARKIDSDLAHIDMEEFKSEDMHSLLSATKADTGLPDKTACETSFSQDDCSLTDGSLCKSGPLFSPQRMVNHPEFSTDSLNSDKEEWIDEAERDAQHLLLTVDCKTNMTNYTLAWSSGTDVDYNEPGSSTSGSDHSHWSSSGGGCGIRSGPHYAPPIPPWPSRAGVSCATWPRIDRAVNMAPSYPIVHNFQTLQQRSPMKSGPDAKLRAQTNNVNQQCGQSAQNRMNLQNTQPSDADNGNNESDSKGTRSPHNTKTDTETPNSSTEALSLLQIYMRQKSNSTPKIHKNEDNDVIACGGGEGWVEDYPSSVDGKISFESDSSSLCHDSKDARSMTLTDTSDIEQTSLQIDAQPFNCPQKLVNSCGTASSLDKLIAKIKPFEIGLSPGSIDETWNFQQCRPKKDEKGCQTQPASSADKATLTDSSPPAVYVIFPSYSMPDLSFLKKGHWSENTVIAPQNFSPNEKLAGDKEALKNIDDILKKDLSYINDWDSLNVLLPKEIRDAVNGHYTPRNRTNPKPQRPKSCDAGVILREHKNQRSQRSSGYRGSSTITWTESGFTLPTVPQSPPSPHSPCGETPPPLPKRTASLPANRAETARDCSAGQSTQKRPVSAKNLQDKELSHAVVNKPKTLSLPKQSTEYDEHVEYAPNLRKTVSFGEYLCGGLGISKTKSKQRPLSMSIMDPAYEQLDRTSTEAQATCNMDRMNGLVQEASVAAAQLCRLMHQSLINDEDEDAGLLMKHISRTITGKLSPALYEVLSDGLLPHVNTFFGHVTNSVWRVVEASVKKGPTLPWVEELVFCLNNEDSLPEGPIRFGVFVAELVNMGALDWWVDNLACKEAIIRRHYAPNGFLYSCHTSTRSLMQELKTALKPLASLPLECSVPWNAEVSWKNKSVKTPPSKTTTPTKATPTKSTSSPRSSPKGSPVKSTPTKSNVRMQRPLSCVETPSKVSTAAAAARPSYRRAQSQHQMAAPSSSNNVVTEKGEPFSSLKKKWEKLSCEKKPLTATDTGKGQQNATQSPNRSRIPRPVSRVLK